MATVVGFVKRFLEDVSWAVGGIRKILGGRSGFTDEGTGEDLFLPRLAYLQGVRPETLYKDIALSVFHGRGGIEVCELKGIEGELGLRVSAPAGQALPYFGVINIGHVSAFKKHLGESLGLEVREDRFSGSLFGHIDSPDSRINLLIGSKKFIEGWSSWRVSTMGLLNMGKGEGPQVIQLFGRGIRLKGKGWSLKRSTALTPAETIPDGLAEVETLSIFGWNADYIQAFRGMIEEEELGHEVHIPVHRNFDPWPKLFIPQPKSDYNAAAETWSLDLVEGVTVEVDFIPQVAALAGACVGSGQVGRAVEIDFSQTETAGLLDCDALYEDLLAYKSARRYGNVFVPRNALLPILGASTLRMSAHDAGDPEQLQAGAATVLRTYLDRFVAFCEREADSRHLIPKPLPAVHEAIPQYYTIRTTSDELVREIEELLNDTKSLFKSMETATHLPRLFIEWHLFKPILLSPKGKREEDTSVSQPGLREEEAQLLKDLRSFWAAHHAKPEYAKVHVYVLRNLGRVGVGFFRRSGFYPDFLIWLQKRSSQETHLRFVEPHGLHHGGLTGSNLDKIAALQYLAEVSRQPAFRSKKISMDGYVVTNTQLDQIPGAQGKTWAQLRQDYRVLRQGGSYMETILALD